MSSSTDRRPLPAGEYWPDELVGMVAVDAAGRRLGTVTGVAFGPVQDRLIVADEDGAEWEIPFVDELVPEVDTRTGAVVLSPIEGLLS